MTTIRSAGQRKTAPRESLALQFLVVLTKTNPLIWRRIVVPGDYSFWDLHVAIQDAMGWQDCHLHEFRIVHPQRGELDRLGIPVDDFPDERPLKRDSDVPISEYFNWDTATDTPAALYVYDFGDEWHHLVTLEEVRPAVRHPRCVAGARACPPEDCGGVHGFANFLDAIANPKHPEHSQLMEWSGGVYDPAAFDPARVVFDNPRLRWKKAFQE